VRVDVQRDVYEIVPAGQGLVQGQDLGLLLNAGGTPDGHIFDQYDPMAEVRQFEHPAGFDVGQAADEGDGQCRRGGRRRRHRRRGGHGGGWAARADILRRPAARSGAGGRRGAGGEGQR
jgi:hypothetical protein